jgi:hypothetical protein
MELRVDDAEGREQAQHIGEPRRVVVPPDELLAVVQGDQQPVAVDGQGPDAQRRRAPLVVLPP